MVRRIRIYHNLPPLRIVLPKFNELHAVPTRTLDLLNQIRKIIERIQTDQPQPFYSTREIASFFRIDQKVAVQVYALLESEGFLARVRSSRTTLLGRSTKVLHPVRGVVGVPIWQHGYICIASWRSFFHELENELSEHFFVSQFIFFNLQIEVDKEKFTQKLLTRNIDHLIWFKPLREYQVIMDILKDNAIQSVVVTDNGETWRYPVYRLDRKKAILDALSRWSKEGVNLFHLYHLETSPDPLGEGYGFLAEYQSKLVITPTNSHLLPSQIQKNVDKKSDAILFIHEDLTSEITRARADCLPEILREYRVLIHAPLFNHKYYYRDCRADIISIGWKGLASKIATDLALSYGRATHDQVAEAELLRNQELEQWTDIL